MRVDAASGTRLLYNLRFRAILYQVIAVGSIVLLGLYLFSNVSQKLAEQNIATGFDFLRRKAGFVISQTFIDYKPTDTYGRAILAGIVNTIWVSAWSRRARHDHRADSSASPASPAIRCSLFWRFSMSKRCAMCLCCSISSSGTP